jgi:hypothetical protein
MKISFAKKVDLSKDEHHFGQWMIHGDKSPEDRETLTFRTKILIRIEVMKDTVMLQTVDVIDRSIA